MSLSTSRLSVEKLQSSLQAKAKSEPGFRFYSLWDKVYRADVLREAYRRSRANAGSPGVDGVDFEVIEAEGVERWLGTLQEELRSKSYAPQPLLRVWIEKRNGGQRPLSIPTVKDRVVQTAVVLVLGPIFEADLRPQQYGFRPGVDAKMAVRRAYFHITQHGRREVPRREERHRRFLRTSTSGAFFWRGMTTAIVFDSMRTSSIMPTIS